MTPIKWKDIQEGKEKDKKMEKQENKALEASSARCEPTSCTFTAADKANCCPALAGLTTGFA